MYLKKNYATFSKLNYKNNLISPILRKNNKVQIYLYKFYKNRMEMVITTGKIISIKKKNNFLSTTTITIKQKLYGIIVCTTYNLNSISVIGVRLLQS